MKLEEKSNNNKVTKRNRTKKMELCRDIQSNDIKRVASLRSTPRPTTNLLNNKGIFEKKCS